MKILNKIILLAIITSSIDSSLFAMQDDKKSQHSLVRSQRSNSMDAESTTEAPATKKHAQETPSGIEQRSYFDNLPTEVIFCEILPNIIGTIHSKDDFVRAIKEISRLKLVCRYFRDLLSMDQIICILKNIGFGPNDRINNPGNEFHNATPLHLVAALETEQMPQDVTAQLTHALITHGADVNARIGNPGGDYDEYTPLALAAESQNKSMIRTLIEHGCDINAIIKGNTSLAIAIQIGNLELVHELLTHGANPNITITDEADILLYGYTPLHIATGLCFEDENIVSQIIDELIAHGADINARINSPEGAAHDFTPLQFATFIQNDAAIKKLIEHGAHE